MRKIVAIKVGFYFDPIDTRWTTMSDFEHWLSKHLAENNMEAERIEVVGNPSELMLIIKNKLEAIVTQKPFKPRVSNLADQFKNLAKGTK